MSMRNLARNRPEEKGRNGRERGEIGCLCFSLSSKPLSYFLRRRGLS